MKKFQRSPSKVWWAEEALNWSQRSTSSSSGSQEDSGFSDTEQSPGHSKKSETNPNQLAGPPQNLPKDILKDVTSSSINTQNLSANFKEKSTPKKKSPFYTKKETAKKSPSRRFSSIEEGDDVAGAVVACSSLNKHVVQEEVVNNRVNRSLFNNRDAKETARDQNVEGNSSEFQKPCDNNNRTEIPQQFSESSSVDETDACTTYPFLSTSPYFLQKNNSAPALVHYKNGNELDGQTSRKNSLSSTDESELESLFNENLGSPKHTSTPKGHFAKKDDSMRHKRVKHLYQKYQNERILRRRMRFENENISVKKWLEEARGVYDSECMIMLQCKSVAGDLAQKVSHMANVLTCPLRKLLYMGENIEKEFENIKSQNQYSAPLAQSLTGHIAEFATNFIEGTNDLLAKCEEIKHSSLESPGLIDNLYTKWSSIFQEILVKYLKKLVCYLEDPRSEFELRATLTAITSLTLRNESFAEIFTSCDTISTLCVLCEKCEGSSVRTLILRALSTICNNTPAIRQLERSSGIQMITDILIEEKRPEPERAEALALLAQATGPWIEDNGNLKSLHNHLKQLIKIITHFITATKCCQNLLLCSAVIANLSTLEPRSVKYILNQNTVGHLLERIKERGRDISIYLLEQVSIILANLSLKQEAREHMVEENVVRILLYFLQANSEDKYAVQRIQQKAIVALSRLSGHKKAAKQLVDQGGISKLASLCRDKERRYDSDAVLVAALATLRKVAEICGTSTIDEEDLQELVQPRLLDSFLTYSAQNESYV